MSNHTIEDPTAGVASTHRRHFRILAWLSGILLFLCITVGLWQCGGRAEKLIHRNTRNTCRLLVDQTMYIEHWEKLATEEMARELVKHLAADLNKEDYSSAFIKASQNGQPFMEAGPAGGSATDSDNAERPRQELDAFEQHILAEFVKAGSAQAPAFVGRFVDDGSEYQYYQPIYAESQTCVTCHNAIEFRSLLAAGAPLEKGDLMAVAKITLPYGPTQQVLNYNRVVLLTAAGSTAFLFVVFVVSVVGLIRSCRN